MQHNVIKYSYNRNEVTHNTIYYEKFKLNLNNDVVIIVAKT